jgi:hypothetical protein
MKKTTLILLLILGLGLAAYSQDDVAVKSQPTAADKTAVIPTGSYLKRGAPIGISKRVSINDALKKPGNYAGKTVLIEGLIVRSCKIEGCWAEVAENKDSKSVRVKMKDHAFFIPLESAGAKARVEGTFQVKTLSKAMVDHMIEEDGAKFEGRNADGTVTEVSFEASGIELKRAN